MQLHPTRDMPQLSNRPPKRQRSNGLAAALYAGSPLERLAITLGTGVALFLMFLVYREVAHGLRPTKGRVTRSRIAGEAGSQAAHYESPEDRGTRKAVRYLPNTWVAKASTCIETSEGRTHCYFQEWTRESSHVIKFTPFAMISSRKGDKPDDQPYTVMSDKAYVTFKDEFGTLGKNPGPVVQAGLEGTVVITGPNNLKIRGATSSSNAKRCESIPTIWSTSKRISTRRPPRAFKLTWLPSRRAAQTTPWPFPGSAASSSCRMSQ